MKKFLLFFIFLSSAFVHFDVSADKPYKGTIAAVVNDAPISLKDLDDRVNLILLTSPAAPSAEERSLLKRKNLKQMIEETLQLQEAALYEIEVEEEEIENYISNLEKHNKWASGHVKSMLKEKNIPITTLRNQIRATLSWYKLTSAFKRAARIGTKDIKEALTHIQNRNQPKYLLAEIVIPFTNPTEEAQAEQMLNMINAEIQQGKPFPVAAQQYSLSPSAALGGDIGWIDEDQLDPEIEDVVKQMEVSGLTNPIKTNSAYKVILLRGKNKGPAIQDILKVRQLEVLFPILMSKEEKAQETARVVARMQSVKNCKDFEKMADEIEGATLQIHENIMTDQLTPSLESVLKKLPVNVVSEPLPVENKSVMFFMVCERRQENTLNLKEEEIKEDLSNKKFESFSSNRLKEMYRRAFIDVRI
jgi:peptidyl-prolyl cis-trans isomerase SurA